MLTAGLLYLALASSAPQAKPNVPGPQFERGAPDKLLIHESTDAADKARVYFDGVARCVARHHQRQSAAVLAMPYGSTEQANAANVLIQAEGSCFGPIFTSTDIYFDPRGLAAGMAEFFLADPNALSEARRRYPASFVWAPANGMDQFGDCVVSQGEAPVRAFIDTPVASAAEQSAAQALAPALGQCISEGQTLAVEPAAMRQVLAVALYRRVAVPPVAAAATAKP